MGTVVTALAAVFSLVRRVEVHGDSMLPSLRPGERLLVVRANRARPGQLVVVRDPRSPHRTLVKRVAAMEGGRAQVTGDNAAASTDSAVFGPVPVVGRVVYRYHPADRAGRLC
ncbi:MAG: nickel-type superoxide dismutase maturation protease [Actinomycetota bacterium]|nr:nickel-type superoxide dismutase maturation protease [Actinomycetota bacterium]PLS75655.1 MAG: nickel-type superoxide dismutase maturation protease [Actinomycetota bacterium]